MAEITDEITVSEITYDIHATNAVDITTGATKRILIRMYANVGQTGSNPTITVTMEGVTDSHVTIDVPSDVWQLHGLMLDDLNTLGQVTANGEFLVGSRVGYRLYEKGKKDRLAFYLGYHSFFSSSGHWPDSISPLFIDDGSLLVDNIRLGYLANTLLKEKTMVAGNSLVFSGVDCRDMVKLCEMVNN